ncbi:MAG TPA: serine hydrolase [Pirellulaceae bacterium]|jgi:CubicO group peptidase (beta-lactamase class C family)
MKRRLRSALWKIAYALLLTRAATADDRFDGLDTYIREAMQKWKIPGLAIAVVKDDELVVARGYGVCEMGSDRAVTKDTPFPIASCTKSFTAACIGMLVDEKKVQWGDPVQKHWPTFAVADSYVTQNATLRDILCHRTGLARGDLLFVKGDFSNDEILRRLKFLPQAEPFRTKMTYNNLMYGVLGQVIEQKSETPWNQFVEQRLIRPLGMTSTYITRVRVPPDRIATRHRNYDGEIAPVRKPFPDERVAESGAIYSSVIDMTKWLQMHLHDGEHQRQQLLKPDTIRDMHSLVHAIPIRRQPDANVYRSKLLGTGYGWFVNDYRGRVLIHHGGGWGADMAIVPEERLAVVVLSNLDFNLLVQMLTCDMIDAYVVGPERAWSKENKWDFWFEVGGPEAMFRSRNEHKADLDKTRAPNTKPSLPLDRYAGRYESDLYGPLFVEYKDGHLSVQFGIRGGDLDHWQNDQFYGLSIVEPFLDWLVKFEVTNVKTITSLEVIGVGWKDPDEKHIFRRMP